METESIKHKFNFIMVPLSHIVKVIGTGYFHNEWPKTAGPNGEVA